LSGIIYTFGIFFKSLAAEFGLSRTAISGVITTYFICHVIGAIPVGWLSDRYGPKRVLFFSNIAAAIGIILLSRALNLLQVYLFFGVLVGLGFSGTFTVLSATTARWFIRFRGLALGIVASGVGAGTMIMAPIVERLIAWFEWRGAYITLGIMTFFMMVLPSFFIYKEPYSIRATPYGRQNSEKKQWKNVGLEQKIDESNSLVNKNVTRTLSFWIILIIFFLLFVCLEMVMTHLYNYATDTGISTLVAARLVGIVGGFSVVGRLTVGTFSDYFDPCISIALCALALAASFILLVSVETKNMFYWFATIYGLAYGGQVPLIPVINVRFFGLKTLGVVVGATMSAACLGAAIGPILGGFIYDLSGGYALAFGSAATISTIIVILALLLRFTQAANEQTIF
jgi:MFS family permease